VFLAPRGLREEDDGRTRTRLAGEWLVAVQRQARKVWVESLTATILVTAAAFVYAMLR